MGGSEGVEVDVLGAEEIGGGTSDGRGAEVIFLVHFLSSWYPFFITKSLGELGPGGSPEPGQASGLFERL